MKTPVPLQVKRDLEGVFEEVIDSSTGAKVYLCSARRAYYLNRWASHIRNQSTVESLVIYTPDQPAYAKGIYWYIQTVPFERGLLVRRVNEPDLTILQMLIFAAYTNHTLRITRKTQKDAQILLQMIANLKTSLRKPDYWTGPLPEIEGVAYTRPLETPCTIVLTNQSLIKGKTEDLTEEALQALADWEKTQD